MIARIQVALVLAAAATSVAAAGDPTPDKSASARRVDIFEEGKPVDPPTMDTVVGGATLRSDPIRPTETWRTVSLMVDSDARGLLLYRLEKNDGQDWLTVLHVRYADFESEKHAYLRSRIAINGHVDDRFRDLGRQVLTRNDDRLRFAVSDSVIVVFNWPAGKPQGLWKGEAEDRERERQIEQACKTEYLTWYQQCRLTKTKCAKSSKFLEDCKARRRTRK